MYPDLQSHLKEPGKLEQSALDEQLLCLDELHSSTSLNKGKKYITSIVAVEKVSIFSLSVDMRRINRSVSISLCSSIRSFLHLLNYSSIPLFINLFVLYSFTQFTIVAKITAWTQTAKPLLAKSCLTS